MALDQYPKPIRSEIRKLAALAHRRELATEFTALEAEFARWRRGELGEFELNERIHRFHDGQSRELWKRYSNTTYLDLCVAFAIVGGVLAESEVEPNVLRALERAISVYRDKR